MSWRLHEGYVRSATWDDEGESITLGLWGPGDVISSEDPVLHPLELHCLTTVVEHLELAVHVLLTARMDSCMSIFRAPRIIGIYRQSDDIKNAALEAAHYAQVHPISFDWQEKCRLWCQCDATAARPEVRWR